MHPPHCPASAHLEQHPFRLLERHRTARRWPRHVLGESDLSRQPGDHVGGHRPVRQAVCKVVLPVIPKQLHDCCNPRVFALSLSSRE